MDVGQCMPSLVSALEPLAGAALAINLAYIGLQRFRYRSNIRRHAREAQEEADRLVASNDDLGWMLGTTWYEDVKRLAALEDHDDSVHPIASSVPPDARGFARQRPMHDSLHGLIYIMLFERHRDRLSCIFFSSGALIVLLLGVAQNINHMTGAICWIGPYAVLVLFYLLAVAVAAPPVFAILGRRIVRWSTALSTDFKCNIGIIMQAEARRATFSPPGRDQTG